MKLIKKENYFVDIDDNNKQYTNDYYDYLITKYELPEKKEKNDKINEIRTDLVNRYCPIEDILDVGCGTGSFLKYMDKNGLCFVYGYEVIPKTINCLKEKNIFIDPFKYIPKNIKGICFWDVLEHIKNHDKLFNNINKNTFVFVSIPIFSNLDNLKKSKHYIPNEHLWYFTKDGFLTYMDKNNFKSIEYNNSEILAGREDILTFVFKKL